MIINHKNDKFRTKNASEKGLGSDGLCPRPSVALVCVPLGSQGRCYDWCGIETESKETMEPGAWTSEFKIGDKKKTRKLGMLKTQRLSTVDTSHGLKTC